jgi:hypothetical protein
MGEEFHYLLECQLLDKDLWINKNTGVDSWVIMGYVFQLYICKFDNSIKRSLKILKR